MRALLTDKNGNISIRHQIVAGATAGACQCIVTSPMEMFKIAGKIWIYEIVDLDKDSLLIVRVDLYYPRGASGVVRPQGVTL